MKIITSIFYLFVSLILKGQTRLTPLNNGLNLSGYLEKNFFFESPTDSCYTGIHYLLITPQKSGSISLEITGNMTLEYRKRIETLLTANIWNKKFIRICRKQRELIIQPMFLDISKNCLNDISILKKPENDSVFKASFEKETLYEIATKLLVQQHLSLIESYKNLSSDIKRNCLLLPQCYIISKPTKKIIM